MEGTEWPLERRWCMGERSSKVPRICSLSHTTVIIGSVVSYARKAGDL